MNINVTGKIVKINKGKMINTKNGQLEYIDFRISVDRGNTDKRYSYFDGKEYGVDFYKVTLLGAKARSFVQYANEGRRVDITGRLLQTEYYSKKDNVIMVSQDNPMYGYLRNAIGQAPSNALSIDQSTGNILMFGKTLIKDSVIQCMEYRWIGGEEQNNFGFQPNNNGFPNVQNGFNNQGQNGFNTNFGNQNGFGNQNQNAFGNQGSFNNQNGFNNQNQGGFDQFNNNQNGFNQFGGNNVGNHNNFSNTSNQGGFSNMPNNFNSNQNGFNNGFEQFNNQNNSNQNQGGFNNPPTFDMSEQKNPVSSPNLNGFGSKEAINDFDNSNISVANEVNFTPEDNQTTDKTAIVDTNIPDPVSVSKSSIENK